MLPNPQNKADQIAGDIIRLTDSDQARKNFVSWLCPFLYQLVRVQQQVPDDCDGSGVMSMWDMKFSQTPVMRCSHTGIPTANPPCVRRLRPECKEMLHFEISNNRDWKGSFPVQAPVALNFLQRVLRWGLLNW